MIVQKSFLNNVKVFGLNSYEAKLWTALLSRGVSTAGELSDIANVPRSRSYDVLESLEKKGFVVMKLGKPIKYIAVPPQEVIERVKKRIDEDAKTNSKMLDDLKGSEVLNELSTLFSQGIDKVDPGDISGSIKGRTNIHNHLETMLKGAEKSVVLAITADGLRRKKDVLKKALSKNKNKLNVRIAIPSGKNVSEIMGDLKGFKHSVEVKQSSDSDARFCIVDGNQLLFMLSNDREVHPSFDTGVWVTTAIFAKSLESMFNDSWKNMKSM